MTSPVLVEAAAGSATRSMQVLLDGKIAYRTDSNSISQQFPMSQGQHNITVQAKGTSGPWVSASVNVTVGPPPSPIAVSVSPASATLAVGATQQFSVTVTGTSNTAVSWSVNGIAGGSGTVGTIDSTGTYSAPGTIPSPATVTVTATSQVDNTQKGSATVTITAPPPVVSVSIAPTSASVQTSGTQQFTSTVTGTTNTTVTWLANGIVGGNGTIGTITAGGLYTGPSSVPNPATVTITATSQADNSKAASAAVTVILPTNSPNNSITVFEVDGTVQTNRPITLGRVFAQGEIAACPQPVVGGTPIANYQADVKNRWPDNSVKFAVISFTQTLTASSSTLITFQSTASCNNTSFLTQAQMTGFNSGNWGAQMVVSAAGSTSVTADAKTMLASSDPGTNTFGDCKNDYWLKGPVVTAVIVQDCTSASQFDFGWSWNGSTMTNPVTGNASTASLHPLFILYFYPAINSVQVEAILENPWVGRAQDQLADIQFKGGSSLTNIWSHTGARRLTDVTATNGSDIITSASASFSSTDVGLPVFISGSGIYDWYTITSVTNSTTAVLSAALSGSGGANQLTYINLQGYGTRHRKVFWSNSNGSGGAAGPGHIRVDHNFAYLKWTLAFPNYDSSVTVSPDNNDVNNGATSWSVWSATDKGDIGGYGGFSAWTQDYTANKEGAPLQREDLLYLYNMGTCGMANSACAKAWQMLTGESGAIDTSLTVGNVTGGGGAWFNSGNVPFHLRESRMTATGQISSGNSFYCPNLADKDANPTATTTCGSGTGTATGKVLSRHAHSDAQYTVGNPAITAVGTLSNPTTGWAAGGCDHWLDYSYAPYLLTGSPYYLEDEFQAAAFCLDSQNPTNYVYTSNGFFGYMNPIGSSLRITAWGVQTIGRAAFIAPDGTPEASYFLGMLNSNLEVQEGIMGVTGTSLTPSDTSCSSGSVSNYNYRAANRWNWGRCTVISACLNSGSGTCTTIPVALHAAAAGSCPTSGEESFVEPTVTSAWSINWMYNALGVVTSELRELGYTQAAGVGNETQKQLEEKVGDSNYSPYLIAMGVDPIRDASGGTSCSGSFGQNTDPFIGTYARLKSGAVGRSVTTFDFDPSIGSFPCADHGYSLIARAAGSFLQYFATSSTDANCSGGTCTAAGTWAWMNSYIPFFKNSPPTSNSCATPVDWKDAQIKWALTPR